MSFILDALRKSESERRREAPPTIARVPLAPARSRAPFWIWVVIAAMSLAIIVLAGAWWQSDGGTTIPAPSSEAAPSLDVTETRSSNPPPAAAEEPAQASPPLSIDDLAAIDPNVPALALELLGYTAENPDRRFVMINGSRYSAGQRVPGGPIVEEIRSDGVVLSHRGQRFLLTQR